MFPQKVTVHAGGREVVVKPGIEAVPFSKTLAEYNADPTIVEGVPGYTCKPIGIFVEFVGTFAAATSAIFSKIKGGTLGADVASVVVANMNDDKWSEANAELVLGAGFLAPGNPGEGIQLRNNGSAATGGTTVRGVVYVQFNNDD